MREFHGAKETLGKSVDGWVVSFIHRPVRSLCKTILYWSFRYLIDGCLVPNKL